MSNYRLQQYVNRELPDVQAGFRKGRGTRDQIANIRWIMEKAREFQKNIYFCFIDYPKAFDCVDQSGDIRDVDLISGLGRSPGEGNGNPLQYSCLKNPMDRGAWWATVHGVTKSLKPSSASCREPRCVKRIKLLVLKISFGF